MKRILAITLALVASLAQAAEVRYMLWDSDQQPAYRECARRFEQQHPDISIRFQQAGWADYWTALSTGFIAGTAPDVFVNHLAKFPELLKNGQLLDLAPLLRRDPVDPQAFMPGLFGIWGRDGGQYGLPKDWDMVALAVNLDMAERAGVTREELWSMTWNPVDGGSFERIARRLSRDVAGRSAADPGFDRRRVRVYGFQTPGPGGALGQTEWSHFAASMGFTLQDQPWAPRLHYDDPRLAQTLAYIAGLPGKGVSARFELTRSLGSAAMFIAGKAAMVPDGSWMVANFARNAHFRHAWVPLPVGPTGRRASMMNGLGDSIWAGSKVKEQAWAWVRFMASPQCQRLVADAGVTYPALRGMAELAVQAQARRGVDSAAFLAMSHERNFPMPIAEHGAEINDWVGTAIESVLIGKSDAATAMQTVDARVLRLLQP
ncbi:ABC transporter substrate-binding protein [Roseateles saccharophilus]|uniref:sn-glycerol-3-phosphate-binding periplasmic protein UgpB n=1 Tax=Roseateles saccharophilus TaxID=304 RepID=A0A4R3VE88_ROSSA|nr:sugar ABC transporter substrate-binding protein [Roseateles saccharophilus]MDG0835381.1 sugar ABC transporter substrate-binding protein [Roseateles saccharophilus]TCV02243.1 carbohydrate ABC transporter substrate-binding protein (CUT1 family) [Roseateles saccharophilus]